jgi:hypothetical protein
MNKKTKAGAAKAPAKKSPVRKAVRIFWIVLASGFGLFLLVVIMAMLGVFSASCLP